VRWNRCRRISGHVARFPLRHTSCDLLECLVRMVRRRPRQTVRAFPLVHGGSPMLSVEERTAGLNRLIRGELSAIETYRQALDKMKDAPEATELHSMMVEHRSAVQVLRDHVQQRGGSPADSSGPWGAWAKLVEGAAQLFGNAAALNALKEGEEHGIKEYER